MPPGGPLGPDQISIIKAWIDQGAEWPDALAGDVVVTRPDPIVVQIMQSLRNGEHGGFQRLVKENSESLNAKGAGGWTPIMYAALYGDANDVRLLLERGADPNTQNDDGGTALMYAIDARQKSGCCSTTVRQMWTRFPATVELPSRLRWPTPGRQTS